MSSKVSHDWIKERVAALNQIIRLARTEKEHLLSVKNIELHEDGCETGGT